MGRTHELVVPRKGVNRLPLRDSVGRMLLAAASFGLTVVVVLLASSGSGGGANSAAAKLLQVHRLKQMTGHYTEDGVIHYYKLEAPPPSAYFQPGSDGAGEYRSASTSGLGFAGGGDPYKYIRTGHYAKILADEDRLQRAGQNGTASFMKQVGMQELAARSIKSRDESLLKLLSAEVPKSILGDVLHGKGSKGSKERLVRNLNAYIKQQVDSFTQPERKKLESFDRQQLSQLKTQIVLAAAKEMKEGQEEGTKEPSAAPKPSQAAHKPHTVQQNILAAKEAAVKLETANQQIFRFVKTWKLPHLPKYENSIVYTPKYENGVVSAPVAEVKRVVQQTAKATKMTQTSNLLVNEKEIRTLERKWAEKRKELGRNGPESDKDARSWTPPPVPKAAASLASAAFGPFVQLLYEKSEGTLEREWTAKRKELGISSAAKNTAENKNAAEPDAPSKEDKQQLNQVVNAKKLTVEQEIMAIKKRASKLEGLSPASSTVQKSAVSQVTEVKQEGSTREDGFREIENARKTKEIENARKKASKHLMDQDGKTAESYEATLDGEVQNRAARGVGLIDNAYWDDKEAKKLAHAPVTVSNGGGLMDSEGHRTTPAMSDPYRYIRTGNYAKILADEALKSPPYHTP